MTQELTTTVTGCGVPTEEHAHSHSPSDVLDLDGLRNRCLGNLALVQRVLDKFEQKLPEELAELDRVLELKDPERIALVAHRIKGTSANVSAEGITRAAAEIEALSRAGRIEEISTRIGELHCQWARFITYSASLSSTASAP
jgi:HPt (histidine-containing phosphotransfer) domain-containing protein